jgi:hypothetical protein
MIASTVVKLNYSSAYDDGMTMFSSDTSPTMLGSNKVFFEASATSVVEASFASGVWGSAVTFPTTAATTGTIPLAAYEIGNQAYLLMGGTAGKLFLDKVNAPTLTAVTGQVDAAFGTVIDAGLSADGLTLVYDVAGALYESTRTTASAAFPLGTKLPTTINLGNGSNVSPSITGTCDLYFLHYTGTAAVPYVSVSGP